MGFWATNFWALLGVAVTVLGVGIAIYQIRKTLGAVEIARQAIEDTRSKLQQRLVVSDSSKLAKTAEQVRDSLQAGQLAVAQVRLTELRSGLCRIRPMLEHDQERCEALDYILKTLGDVEISVSRSISTDGIDLLSPTEALESLSATVLFLETLIVQQVLS